MTKKKQYVESDSITLSNYANKDLKLSKAWVNLTSGPWLE